MFTQPHSFHMNIAGVSKRKWSGLACLRVHGHPEGTVPATSDANLTVLERAVKTHMEEGNRTSVIVFNQVVDHLSCAKEHLSNKFDALTNQLLMGSTT